MSKPYRTCLGPVYRATITRTAVGRTQNYATIHDWKHPVTGQVRDRFFEPVGTPGAANALAVGTTGTATYLSTPHMGMWLFTPDDVEEAP